MLRVVRHTPLGLNRLRDAIDLFERWSALDSTPLTMMGRMHIRSRSERRL